MKKWLVSLVVLILAMSLAGCGSQDKKADNDGKKKFVLITMDSMDEHWLSVKAGAEKKAQELGGIDIVFRAPAGKVDPNEQTRMVEDAINQKADAILIAPSDKAALAPAVKRAIEAKIPVVVIDSAVDCDGYVEFLSTDNYKAAVMAAEEMAKLIHQEGKVAIISAQAGSATTMTREKGFQDTIKEKYPNIQIVSVQYSNGDKAVALNQATDMMTANKDLKGFYTTNEGSTVGVARAIDEAKQQGKIILVGFDKSKDTIAGIENGIIQATMVQNPYKMGYDGVQAAWDAINGKTPEKIVDTGVQVVTKANVGEIKQ